MIEKIKTPCYVFNREDFEKNLSMFMNTLNSYFGENWILGYSFKTNYLPYVINCAKNNGCYAEVVSSKEYMLAKRVGYASEKIVYNGPVKDKKTFLEAVVNGCIVNIDSKREIDWLKELPKHNNYTVGIRVNFDLENILPGHTLMGKEGGRFGFCDDNAELSNAIKKINEMNNIQIICLHMHISSKTKDVQIYRHLIRKACEIIDREKLNICYIDVGGSFFGGGDDGTAYVNYMKEIKATLNECDKSDMGIIVEPGASVIASSVSYIIEVIDKKDTKQNHYLVTDGSRLHIDPFFVRSNYSYEIISNNEITEVEQSIVGFTCMEKDRIIKIVGDKQLEVGDRIVFHTVGSYTMCMNSDFISSEPRVYAKYGENICLVRKEKDIESYIVNNALEEVW